MEVETVTDPSPSAVPVDRKILEQQCAKIAELEKEVSELRPIKKEQDQERHTYVTSNLDAIKSGIEAIQSHASDVNERQTLASLSEWGSALSQMESNQLKEEFGMIATIKCASAMKRKHDEAQLEMEKMQKFRDAKDAEYNKLAKAHDMQLSELTRIKQQYDDMCCLAKEQQANIDHSVRRSTFGFGRDFTKPSNRERTPMMPIEPEFGVVSEGARRAMHKINTPTSMQSETDSSVPATDASVLKSTLAEPNLATTETHNESSQSMIAPNVPSTHPNPTQNQPLPTYYSTTANASAKNYQKSISDLADFVMSTSVGSGSMMFMGSETPHALLGRNGALHHSSYASSSNMPSTSSLSYL